MADRRGRKPKTAEQRVLDAATGRGPVKTRKPPQPLVLAPRITEYQRPQCPADIPPEGKELWEESVEWLIDRNAAQLIDTPALRLMCIHYGLAQQAANVIGEQGAFSRGSVGQVTEHPANRLFERQSALFLRYATEFGLSTLARTRLGLLDVTRRSIESDLNSSLGRNPRRTHRNASSG